MSTKLIRRGLLVLAVSMLLALPLSSASAQTIRPLPTVTIRATDPIAKEPLDNGEFTVYRTNDTSTAQLRVYYLISGTATNGVDYVKLTGSVVIPAGAVSARIPVTVSDDFLPERPETVTLTITDPCYSILPCVYYIGTPRSATVTIYDNDY